MSKTFYTYDELYELMDSMFSGEIYYKQIKNNTAISDKFIFYSVNNINDYLADNTNHFQSVDITLYIYYKDEETDIADDEIKLFYKYFRDKMKAKIYILKSSDVHGLGGNNIFDNYSMIKLNFTIFTDVIDWL